MNNFAITVILLIVFEYEYLLKYNKYIIRYYGNIANLWIYINF